jgi:hypothetical protein
MHGTLTQRIHEAREIQGRLLRGEDKIVPPPNWVWFARHLWPTKTAAHLAAIANKDERTAKRWLAGEFEPPGVVMAALIAKLFERPE